MNEETPEQFRQRVEQLDGNFFEQFGKRGAPMLDRAFEYEKLAVGYSEKGFQSLTYLNGGALVAIPSAMTFFKAEVARGDVVWMAVAFVVGLTCVVVAQAHAFMTMARRSEAQIRFAYGNSTASQHFNISTVHPKTSKASPPRMPSGLPETTRTVVPIFGGA